MAQNVCQFQISVQYLMLIKVVKSINYFAEDLDGFFFCEVSSFFDVGIEVTIVTIFQY